MQRDAAILKTEVRDLKRKLADEEKTKAALSRQLREDKIKITNLERKNSALTSERVVLNNNLKIAEAKAKKQKHLEGITQRNIQGLKTKVQGLKTENIVLQGKEK